MLEKQLQVKKKQRKSQEDEETSPKDVNNVEAMRKERNQIFYNEVDKIINKTIKDYVQKTVFDE